MPNYSFKCLRPECGIEFQEMFTIAQLEAGQADWTDCPKCERIKTKRIIKAPAINVHPWRKRLVDQPYEIDAIEAGVYE